MSELKDYKVYTTRHEGAWGYHYEPDPNKDQSDIELNGEHVYLKSEVDKVIVEKDKEIARLDDLAHEHNIELLRKENLIAELKKERDWLAKDRAQAYDDLEKRAQLNIKQEDSIRHSNHKRCLAMAQRCMDAECKTEKDADFLVRWEHLWLALAEEPTWAKFLQLIRKEATNAVDKSNA